MKCKCGQEPKLQLDLQCGCANWFIKCPECLSHTTKSYKDPKDAEKEWERMQRNFPTCETCEYHDDGDPELCTYHDRGTEATWTCPDHTPKDDIEVYTHTHNKNLLDTHFGASSGELLKGLTIRKEIDYKAEFLKLEKDYFEDVADLKADLKKEQDKSCYWFEKHSEEQEQHEYWQKEWQKASQENEKLNMLIGKIKEAVE